MTPQQLATTRYEESGLTPEDAKLLKIKVLSAAQTQALGTEFQNRPSIMLRYVDPMQPTKFLYAHGERDPFCRIRYTDEPTGFAAQTEKPPRYAQARDTGVKAYFPGNASWPVISTNTAIPIIITEGELKAAKACKEGFATIGLGGVDSFRSTNMGYMFLPELEGVNWTKRRVYIAYDSDVNSNGNVAKALNALAHQLMMRGALPYQASLPDIPEAPGKTGLDDFLIAREGDGLQAVIATARPLTLSAALWKLNKEVIYVRNPGIVLDQADGHKMKPSAFKEHHFADHSSAELVLKPDNTVSMKEMPLPDVWMKWPLRNRVNRFTYQPGAERVIENCRGYEYNEWGGWGVEPKKGNIKPFTDLVDHLFTGSESEAKEWFLRWLAYPLQHPGTKIFNAVVMYGVQQGTGKSLIGYTMKEIYGKDNFTAITQTDLDSSFNGWSVHKQFVMGEEVSGLDKRAHADSLKNLITQLDVSVNIKNVPTYTLPDCINYYFTSNHSNAFFLADQDRRFFVHEVEVEALSDEFYADYDKWLRKKGGAAALFHYLRNLDLGDWNPAARAYATAAKSRMIAQGKSDLALWVENLLGDIEGVLRLGTMSVDSDLWTSAELLSIYDPAGHTKVKARGIAHELAKAGVRQLCDGTAVRTASGRARYYALRNTNKWQKATPQEVREYIDGLNIVEEREVNY